MNYTIISDYDKLKEFIEWLPDLKQNEKYYLSLFARKKYDPINVRSSDKGQLKRFLARKDNMLNKIEQLEVEYGTYKLADKYIPGNALVLYINPNPRDMEKAAYDMLVKTAVLLKSKAKGFNIHAEALSCIQRSKGTKYFVDFDIDDKLFNIDSIKGVLSPDSYSIVQTRGGFHVLVHTAMMTDKGWYNKLKDLIGNDLDQAGDMLLPVPGTIQGNYVPEFLHKALMVSK